jgi:hypothetical protein
MAAKVRLEGVATISSARGSRPEHIVMSIVEGWTKKVGGGVYIVGK